jgi:hypothetical protein
MSDVFGPRQHAFDLPVIGPIIADRSRPIDGDITRRLGPELRCFGSDGVLNSHHGPMHRVVDLDRLRGLLREFDGFGNNERHRLTHVQDASIGEHWPIRDLEHSSVSTDHWNRSTQVSHALGSHIGCGQHGEHARMPARRFAVYHPNISESVRCTYEEGRGPPRSLQVVNERAETAQKALVLDPRLRPRRRRRAAVHIH